MDSRTLPGTPPVSIQLRRSSRARRLSLRVSRLDGRVTLTLPVRASESEALSFAHTKADWIRAQLAARPDQVVVAAQSVLPVEGIPLPIKPGKGRTARIEGGAIYAPLGREALSVQVMLKHLARERLASATDRYCEKLDRTASKLTLRDTRSRWGSCSSEGALMFSWRLIMAPPAVLEYVAAHEVAHLERMDHSPVFWDVVERLFPDHQAQRNWLRQEGETLHCYQFVAPINAD